MLVTVAVICGVVLSAAVLVKRKRNRDELERHSITPEELRALLATDNGVALFDVRLPLDLLGDSVLIPGAKRLPPEDVIANPSLIPKDRDSIVYCTCPSDKTSRLVLSRALAKGLLRIKFLKGGLDAWKARGFPVEPYDRPFHLDTDRGVAVAR
jgi:rhodanese-related sulfurtransferase